MARYFLNIGANTNDTANWSDTSGGAGGFSVPTNTDDVFFDANSRSAVTVNAALNCKTVNFTGYTGTITMTNGITSAGSITLSNTMTIAGAGGLTMAATGTFTSNGKTWPNNFTISAIGTVTFVGNLIVTGSFTQVNTVTIAGSPTITVGGNITFDSISGVGSAWVMNGTGTYRGINPTGSTITFNTAGTITMSTAQTNGLNNFTHTAGTVITSNSTTNFNGTYTGAAVTWNSVNIVGVVTVTLSSDLNCGSSGTFTYGALGQTATINGAFFINVAGNFVMGGTSSTTSGTATIKLTGSGKTISSTQTSLGLQNNLIIDGTYTLTTGFRYQTGTITRNSGGITGGTLTLVGSCTLNTSGNTWNAVAPLAGTITINSLLTADSLTVGLNGNVTFAGSAGYTVGTFTCATAGRTITHTIGRTYTVSNALNVTGTSASRITFNSSSAGTRATFNLGLTATQSVVECNGTDIDSSGGQTILTSAGTLNNTINWNLPSVGAFPFFT